MLRLLRAIAVTVLLSVLGAAVGALVMTVTFSAFSAVLWLFQGEAGAQLSLINYLREGLPVTTVFGGILGVLLGPMVGWMLGRTVPIGRAIWQPALGAGIGILLGTPLYILGIALGATLGCLGAVMRLRSGGASRLADGQQGESNE